MPRKKSPDAKDVTMSARFSETEAAAIDEARGTEDRSVFVRRATLAMAREKQDSGIRERLGVEIVTDDCQPPGTVSVVSRGEEKAEDRSFALTAGEPAPAKRKRCRHPGTRVIGGWCKPCGHMIEPGGYWRE